MFVYILVQVFCFSRHRNDNGGFLLTDIAHNPIADPSWFELACATSMEDINAIARPRNLKWKTIAFAMRTVFKFGISRSALAMDLAHTDGSTPLSCASRQGNVKVVRWLLNNGALKSLHLKTQNGRSPLDLSRIFGPHREVSRHSNFASVERFVCHHLICNRLVCHRLPSGGGRARLGHAG